jgi:hypothetical protein
LKQYTVIIEREVAVTVLAEDKEQAEETVMSKNFKGEEELLLNRVAEVTE